MRREIGHALTAEVPEGWLVGESEGLIELEPPSGDGAIHISVVRKTEPGPPTEMEARALLEYFPVWASASWTSEIIVDPTVREVSATGECVDGEGRTWDVASRVTESRGLVFSFNTDAPEGGQRQQARRILETIQGLEVD
jgi:hypothetical protein